MSKPSTQSDSESDALSPAFLTEAGAADYVGLTSHQLYLYRRRGGGPPFVQFGARIRYPLAELQHWARNLPRFVSRAQAYAANPARAEGARRQRATTAIARKARWDKHQDGATDDA